MKFKRKLRKIKVKIEIGIRKLNAKNRALPNFLIIGAQKAGTTSLYAYLCKHPHISSAFKKEVHYFDLNYSKGTNWYRSFFPLTKTLHKYKPSFITGEASPQYMFHPHSISRIIKDLPDIKIIILLRNPIFRTFSHYQHQVRVGREKLTFEEAIENEESRLINELDKMKENEYYNSYKYLMFSYIKRSIYHSQLKDILSQFKREDVLVIQSERFNEFPQEVYTKVLSFLGLPPYELDFSKQYNSHAYPAMKEETFSKLEELFRPYNENLYELLGERFDW